MGSQKFFNFPLNMICYLYHPMYTVWALSWRTVLDPINLLWLLKCQHNCKTTNYECFHH
uniref:Uncharacterized protein n=1 Tax=Arundo donax TaxID=35708 RepID=A0A0A9HHW3_ARUDO